MDKHLSLTVNIGTSNGSFLLGALRPGFTHQIEGGTNNTRGSLVIYRDEDGGEVGRIGLDHISTGAVENARTQLRGMGVDVNTLSYVELAAADSDSSKGGACGSNWRVALTKEKAAKISHRGILKGRVITYWEDNVNALMDDDIPCFLFAAFAVSATRTDAWQNAKAPLGKYVQQTEAEKKAGKAQRMLAEAVSLEEKAAVLRGLVALLLPEPAKKGKRKAKAS